MKFEFIYDGFMLDIEAETEADMELLDKLRGRAADVLANGRFKSTHRRALVITFPFNSRKEEEGE